MNTNAVRQVVTLIAVVATVVVNLLANALPINGQTTAEISDRFPVFFVPAGYVFSIWGLIYLGLLAYGVFQALPAQRDNPRLRRIDGLFVLGSVANIAWILLWHYEQFPLTLVAMLVLLGALIGVYLSLDIGRARVPSRERWLVHLPFSIYLGWITVATIANATALLSYLEWDGWGIAPEVWAVIMLGAGVVLAVLMSLTRGDVAYLLVLVWAFVGIAVKHADTTLVTVSALIAAALVLAALAAGVILRGRRGGQASLPTAA